MFALTFPLTADNLELLKSEVTSAYPSVKSSHRCEAIGRGLGFKSYAAARVAARQPSSSRVPVNGPAFLDYLSAHDFHVSAKPFYLCAAKVALRDVVDAIPALTMWGMGAGQPRRTAEGRWESAKQSNIRWNDERRELLDHGAEQFLASLALLERVPSTKTIRSKIGSYGIKHIAENYHSTYPTGEKLGPRYVANGALIAAAVYAGFRYKSFYDDLGYQDVNVTFNMPQRHLEDLDCEIRPNGARAQARLARINSQRQTLYG